MKRGSFFRSARLALVAAVCLGAGAANATIVWTADKHPGAKNINFEAQHNVTVVPGDANLGGGTHVGFTFDNAGILLHSQNGVCCIRAADPYDPAKNPDGDKFLRLDGQPEAGWGASVWDFTLDTMGAGSVTLFAWDQDNNMFQATFPVVGTPAENDFLATASGGELITKIRWVSDVHVHDFHHSAVEMEKIQGNGNGAPEPATLLLLGVGLGAAGFAGRRRR